MRIRMSNTNSLTPTAWTRLFTAFGDNNLAMVASMMSVRLHMYCTVLAFLIECAVAILRTIQALSTRNTKSKPHSIRQYAERSAGQTLS